MSIKLNADKILDWYGYTRQRMPFLVKRPLGYFFYITGRCNLICDYCWQREMPDRESKNTRTRDGELSGEEWIKILSTVPKLSFIGLTGGEPLLHPDFKNIIQFLGGKFLYTVNTNGILLSDEILENLIKCKTSNLSISIDGFSDIHDISRKRVGLFDHIVERIECLNILKKKMGSKNPSLTIKTVLLDPLLDKLNEFYLFCEEKLKADCLNISFMKTANHAQYDFRVYNNLQDIKNVGEPACYDYREKGKILTVMDNLLKYSKNRHCKILLYPRMYNRFSMEYLFQNQGKSIFNPCYIPWTFIVILADGTIIPCLSVYMDNIRQLGYDVRRINELEKYKNFLKWRSVMNHNKKSPSECNMCCFSTVKVQ